MTTRRHGASPPRLEDAPAPVRRRRPAGAAAAWDGSEAGPADAPLVELRSRRRRTPAAVAPGRARRRAGLRHRRDRRPRRPRRSPDPRVGGRRGARARAACARRPPRSLARCARPSASAPSAGRPPPPASQARLRGRLHSKLRDRRAISHHYDLSNEFYALILDPHDGLLLRLLHSTTRRTRSRTRSATSSTWSAASSAWSRACASSTSAAAGARCRCTPPSTSAPRSPASRSPPSRSGSSTRGSASAGSSDRVEIRLQDYREIAGRPAIDAVASIEMGEHVGERNYPTYAAGPARRRASPAAGCWSSRCRAPGRAGIPAAARSSSPSSRPTCTCGRSARPSRSSSAAGSRSATCTRCASTTCAPSPAGWRTSRPTCDRLIELVGEEVVARLAALPGRRRDGLPRRPDGRRPDPDGAAGRAAHAAARARLVT